MTQQFFMKLCLSNSFHTCYQCSNIEFFGLYFHDTHSSYSHEMRTTNQLFRDCIIIRVMGLKPCISMVLPCISMVLPCICMHFHGFFYKFFVREPFQNQAMKHPASQANLLLNVTFALNV